MLTMLALTMLAPGFSGGVPVEEMTDLGYAQDAARREQFSNVLVEKNCIITQHQRQCFEDANTLLNYLVEQCSLKERLPHISEELCISAGEDAGQLERTTRSLSDRH